MFKNVSALKCVTIDGLYVTVLCHNEILKQSLAIYASEEPSASIFKVKQYTGTLSSKTPVSVYQVTQNNILKDMSIEKNAFSALEVWPSWKVPIYPDVSDGLWV